MENAAMKAMTEKIARLETQVSNLQSELEKTHKATLGAMLGPLRLHGVVLVHVGTENSTELVESLSQKFGSWAVNQAIRHLFLLNHAPCADEKRDEIRAIFQNGMCRF